MIMSWSDIPFELLIEIMRKLDLVDVIRSGAVCSWWASIPCKDKYSPRSKIPWLMLSSKDKINSRYFYSMTEKKTYEFNLPDIAGHHCVGSGHGYLLSVDNEADLIATNPLTGESHLPIPPTCSHPLVQDVRRDSSGHITHYLNNKNMYLDTKFIMEDFHYKAILSPDRKTVVLINVVQNTLSFTRIGDQSWTMLEMPGLAADMIFHKGRLHAIDFQGTLYIYDLGHTVKPSFISPIGPITGDCAPRRYLVESPDGDKLYLVSRVCYYFGSGEGEISRTNNFKVFIPDDITYKWKQVYTLGEVSLFLGFNYSLSLCATEFPGLHKNCIYFTDDNKESYLCSPKVAGDNGIFNLDDGSIRTLYEDSNLDQLNWPPPIWFLPTIL